MKFLNLLFFVASVCSSPSVFSMSEVVDSKVINCEDYPGSAVCRNIRVLKSYLVDCSSGCDQLLDMQVAWLNEVADSYYGSVNPGDTVAQDLTTISHQTAKAICAYRWNNLMPGEAQRYVTGANRTLGVLRELQRAGGDVSPAFCRISANS